MQSQEELEARYARGVSAKTAFFLRAGDAGEVVEWLRRFGPCRRVVVLDDGLRVPDLRARVADSHAQGERVLVDITAPSSFGCNPFEQGADFSFEALGFNFGGAICSGIVAVASRVALPLESCPLSTRERAAIEEGLDVLGKRMQRRFDSARAFAEYLDCCEWLASVSYPSLASHPDHEVAPRVLRHGFGPMVDFNLPSGWGDSAGALIDRFSGGERPDASPDLPTQLRAPCGRSSHAMRIVAGLDDPLAVIDRLDRAMLRLRREHDGA